MAEKKKKKEQKELTAELRESAQKIWLAGLGALASAEEEGRELFKRLVEQGEKFEARGRERVEGAAEAVKGAGEKTRDRAAGTVEKLGHELDRRVEGALENLGVPTREEIRELTRKVEALTRKVESLQEEQPRGKKTGASKSKKKG